MRKMPGMNGIWLWEGFREQQRAAEVHADAAGELGVSRVRWVCFPGLLAVNPGRRSLRLACPGLRYAVLSGLKKTEKGGAQRCEPAA